MQKNGFLIILCVFLSCSVAKAQNRQEVNILQWSVIDEGEYIKILGEVKNTFTSYLGEVKITIEYFDKNGKPLGVDRFTARDAGTLATDETYAALDVIAPNETAPFERTRDKKKLSGTFGYCKLKATGRLYDKQPPMAAKIEDLHIERTGNDFQITGTYKATGTVACQYPAVVIVGYNDSGQVVRVKNISFSYMDDRYRIIKSLHPGDMYRFKAKLYNLADGSIKTAKVFPYFDM
ncbi:hypothetical protein [Thermonema rossianum]|uniref:hypothetical protein n=1 Tax=Thermonema rossianum TaxID=55505 RepID=UPI00056E81EB|nr:hypothetical protein [Thermonema rossianum]